MSVEKNIIEAQRWLKTAEGDFETAVVLLDQARDSECKRNEPGLPGSCYPK